MNPKHFVTAARVVLAAGLLATLSEPAAAEPIRKDRNGYIINDPAVEAFLKGKNAYYSTDNDLYRSIINGWSYRPYQIAKIVVTQTGDKLHFLLVEQSKQPGVVAKSEFEYTKVTDQFYRGNHTRGNYTSAILRPDGTIMLCNSIRGELLSKDEKVVASATKAALVKQCNEYLAQMKSLRLASEATARAKQDEAFFITGVKAAKRNPALEGKFLRVLNAANALPTVAAKDRASYRRVLLVFTDWEVQKNAAGRPLKMVYAAWAIGRFTQSQQCFYHKVYLKKDHLGGGRYGDVRFDEANSPSLGSCTIIK
jgi:hypothetical protein